MTFFLSQTCLTSGKKTGIPENSILNFLRHFTRFIPFIGFHIRNPLS